MGPTVAVAEVEQHPAVLDAVVVALGHLGDARALPVVLAQVEHPDAPVRYSVAWALPGLLPSDEVIAEDHASAGALARLTEDEDDEVRDRATFALGSLIAVDGTWTRSILRQRLTDPDEETRHEAIIGLAARHDPAVVSLVADALDAREVTPRMLEAAERLRDPRLIPTLDALYARPEVDETSLTAARLACDPAEQATEHRFIAELLEDASHPPGLRIGIASELLGLAAYGPIVLLHRSTGSVSYDLAALRRQVGGSSERAVAVLLSGQTSTDEPN